MESYSFTQALSQCLQLRSWEHGDEGLTQLLDTIIREKTNASQEDLDRRTSHVYSGSLTHRLPCPTMSRGGQSNPTSNLASHVRTSPSTATAHAKKGEDHTTCFQSVFLYGTAAPNIHHHKHGNPPERTAAATTRGRRTRTTPPEAPTPSESPHQGVTTPTATPHPEPTEESTPPHSPRTPSTETSYAAHTAHRSAVRAPNRSDTTRISALEHRAIGDTLTPPFVNLSEMCRLDLESFFRFFMVYLLLLDVGFSRNHHTILAELKELFDDELGSMT